MKALSAACSAIVTLSIRDGKDVAQVSAELLKLQRLTRAEAGCLRFDLFQVEDEPRRLLLLETFVDDAAFALHLQAPYTQEYFALEMTEVIYKTTLSEIRQDVVN